MRVLLAFSISVVVQIYPHFRVCTIFCSLSCLCPTGVCVLSFYAMAAAFCVRYYINYINGYSEVSWALSGKESSSGVNRYPIPSDSYNSNCIFGFFHIHIHLVSLPLYLMQLKWTQFNNWLWYFFHLISLPLLPSRLLH